MSAIWWISALLGVMAGVTTTVAGMGGGTLLVLSLAALGDPLNALVVTSPALLLGNAHRLWQERAHVHWETALRVAPWAVGGALLGGFVAVGLPPLVLSILMLAMASLAAARLLGLRWRPPTASVGPFAALAGGVSATTGGGGMLMGPFLLARGLRGVEYIATGAAAAIAIHVGRNLAYGLGGAAALSDYGRALLIALSIAAGNQLGRALRRSLSEGWLERLQHGVMLGCVALGIWGLVS